MDYYEILGLKKNCNENDIKKTYYKLAKENHPDKVEDSKREEATKKFQKISEAYEILSDPEKRKIYDIHGKEGFNANTNPFDIFSMFNFGRNMNMNNMNANMKRKNKETIFPLNVSLKDIYTGIYKKLKVSKKVIINKETKERIKIEEYGKTWTKCNICQGRGTIVEIRQIGPGFVSQIQKRCENCNEKGFTMLDDFEIIEVTDIIEFDIPKGANDGYSINFSNQGNCSPGTLPGDLIVIIKSNHDDNEGFIRENNNLIYNKKIDLIDALCGVKFDIKTLDNRILNISYDDVITPGEKRIIPNEGINKGKLIIVFEIIFPTNISKQKKEKLKKLII